LANLTTSDGQLYSGYNSLIPINPFTINIGDTLVTTVNFLPGQSMVLNNGNDAWGAGVEFLTIAFENNLDGGYANFTTETTSFSLFTTFAGSINFSGPDSYSYGVVHQNTYRQNFTDSSIQFDGFSMTTTIIALSSGNSDLMNEFAFWGAASGQTQILDVTATPEPATLTLTSFGAAGLLAFRRKK
jgi:hypothetical protein